MTPKLQALLYGIGSAITGYMAYFLALPPQLQTGVLGQLISICPPSWQPAAGATAKTISTLAGLYATYKAAHSGPATPLTNSEAQQKLPTFPIPPMPSTKPNNP